MREPAGQRDTRARPRRSPLRESRFVAAPPGFSRRNRSRAVRRARPRAGGGPARVRFPQRGCPELEETPSPLLQGLFFLPVTQRVIPQHVEALGAALSHLAGSGWEMERLERDGKADYDERSEQHIHPLGVNCWRGRRRTPHGASSPDVSAGPPRGFRPHRDPRGLGSRTERRIRGERTFRTLGGRLCSSMNLGKEAPESRTRGESRLVRGRSACPPAPQAPSIRCRALSPTPRPHVHPGPPP